MQFPEGETRPSIRPAAEKWHGYARAGTEVAASPVVPRSVFDPNFVVLGISGGRRVSLAYTLRLTAALRGLLMRECPVQPPPEWFSLKFQAKHQEKSL